MFKNDANRSKIGIFNQIITLFRPVHFDYNKMGGGIVERCGKRENATAVSLGSKNARPNC